MRFQGQGEVGVLPQCGSTPGRVQDHNARILKNRRAHACTSPSDIHTQGSLFPEMHGTKVLCQHQEVQSAMAAHYTQSAPGAPGNRMCCVSTIQSALAAHYTGCFAVAASVAAAVVAAAGSLLLQLVPLPVHNSPLSGSPAPSSPSRAS